jgi:hypothetical protein
MKRLFIMIGASLVCTAAMAEEQPQAPLTPTEMRAQCEAVIEQTARQRDETMNRLAVVAGELAKTKAELDALKAQAKPAEKK